jgi:two-component system alkaline phosphatase synthesis response regulator PhoP
VSESVDILVIDDNDLQLEYISHLLASHGYNAKTTNNSKNALNIILDVNPKLIILDIMMPTVDGLTVLKNIREHKALSKIPVIIYTGKTFTVDQKKALSLGANSFIAKPSKGSVLVKEIKKYL